MTIPITYTIINNLDHYLYDYSYNMYLIISIIFIYIYIIIIYVTEILKLLNIILNHIDIIEGNLEVKLPTIWTNEKQSREEAERRERLEERRVRRKKMQMREKVGKSRNTALFQ